MVASKKSAKKSTKRSTTKSTRTLPLGLKPLDIKCTSADCDNNLHCFRKSRKMQNAERGKCRYCLADLVDWKRVHKRSIDDVSATFAELRKEFIRHHFWHLPV